MRPLPFAILCAVDIDKLIRYMFRSEEQMSVLVFRVSARKTWFNFGYRRFYEFCVDFVPFLRDTVITGVHFLYIGTSRP